MPTSIAPLPAPLPQRIESGADAAARPDTLRRRLRLETRAAHERLDGCFAALAGGDLADYRRFLLMHEACHRAIGPLVAGSPLAPLRPPAPALHAAALADLAALGLRPIASGRFPISAPSLAQSLGIAYVVEGSSLGARMILAGLRRAARPETGLPPAAFLELAALGAEGFRGFLDLAEGLAVEAGDRDAAVEAADATFDYFHDAARRASAPASMGGDVN